MDRILTYPGETPIVEDILGVNKNAMIGIGALAESMLGQGTVVSGLAASALGSGVVAGSAFAVSVGRGFIFSYQETDPNAYGALGTDTATNILKTGINLTSTNLGLTNSAPATAGQSTNYLISAEFQEVDGGATSIPFYNAGGVPTITVENGVRQQRVIFQVTAGNSAPAGTQTTPATPAGCVPLYVVTIHNGDTVTVGGQIAPAPNSPFIAGLLNSHHDGNPGQAPQINLPSEVQGLLPSANMIAPIALSSSSAVGVTIGASYNGSQSTTFVAPSNGKLLVWGKLNVANAGTASILTALSVNGTTIPNSTDSTAVSQSSFGTVAVTAGETVLSKITVTTTASPGLTGTYSVMSLFIPGG